MTKFNASLSHLNACGIFAWNAKGMIMEDISASEFNRFNEVNSEVET